MLGKKKFSRKPLYKPKTTTYAPSRQNRLIWFGMVVLFFMITYSTGLLKTRATGLTNATAYLASITIGKSMKTDDLNNNINILLVGFGGNGHDGALLTDSIMLASYNAQQHFVTLLSIPRDLLVPYGNDQEVKINSILSRNYALNNSNMELAIQALIRSVNEITGLKIPYYLLINFDEFIGIVDMIDGIDIYVPEHFLDTEYPVDWNGETEIFELFEGRNHLSGPNTLKYARSRHSTSDFSRSARQQDIIKAILNKLSTNNILSVSKLKSLYQTYENSIITNISWDEVIGLAKYGTHLPDIYNFNYNANCILDARRTLSPGCLVQNMRGSLIPQKTHDENTYYYLQKFAQFVTQSPLSQNIDIILYNATDKDLVKNYQFGQGLAGNLAIKLKRYGFPVLSVENAEGILSGSLIEYIATAQNQNIVNQLGQFIDYTGFILRELPDTLELSGSRAGDIRIYLGNDYLDSVGNQAIELY